MISEFRSNETSSQVDAGEEYQQQQQKARGRPMSSSSEVNMTNCYEHCQHFFKRCKDGMIHYDVLIGYWMMGGYLGAVDSIDEAYEKGYRLLWDLIQEGVLKHSDEDLEMIALATPTDSIRVCRHERSCFMESGGFVDLLDLGRIENVVLADGMLKKRRGSVDGNYLSRQVFRSQRGLKYLGHFNPTPNSVKPLLENVEKPSVLMIRGCDEFFTMSSFTFGKFKTLTVLEISGSGLFTTIPIEKTIPKLTQLRYLYLSDPLIDSLPKHLFLHLRELRWLILRGCSRLVFNPDTAHLDNLEVLDLSYTSTTDIPYLLKEKLTHLFLRDSKLCKGRDVHDLERLKLLDLSGNQNVEQVLPLLFLDNLVVLDLSRTQIQSTWFLEDLPRLCHLMLRECTNLQDLSRLCGLRNLKVLDASGCENLLELPEDLGSLKNMKELNLSGCSRLENLRPGLCDQMSSLLKLDLSATKVKRLPSFANLTSLHKLSLRDLELDFVEFESWTSLSSLLELDLHGLRISSSQEFKLDFLQFLTNIQILNLSKTFVTKLPDMSMLGSLKELLLADCRHLKVVPDLQPLTSLETLDLSLPDDTFVNSCQLEAQSGLPLSVPRRLRKLLLTNRSGVQNLFPIASLGNVEFLDLRGTDEIDFITVPSSRMGNLQEERKISKPVQIHMVYDSANQLSVFDRFIYEFESLVALISDIQRNSTSNTANTNNNQANCNKRRFEMLYADLKYIRENIERLKGSHNYKSSEELLQELMDAATHLTAVDFKDDSPNLKQLFRVVVKLKVLFPAPTQANDREASKPTKEKKQPLFIKSANKESSAADINEELSTGECHYQEITNVLQSSYQSLSNTEKNCLLCFSAFPCSKDDEDKTAVLKKSLVIKKRILIYWWAGEGFIDPQNEEYVLRNTIEDIGKQILKVLKEKGFIEPVIRKRWETGSCCMHYSVHSFVTAQAKAEGFFDFNKENSKLAPYFTRPKGDCLLESQGRFHSSAKLRAKYTDSHRELESLRSVSTLFNVDQLVIDIKPEWFSEMRHLSVLYLGSWHSENKKPIEVVDQKFLEYLKKMKQLRLFSLQGLLTIRKLLKSVCKATNLIILDLRECVFLEELPSDIGSLKNLTHLDLTDCLLLSKLPKGISFLLKLEVLRGFQITHEHAAADPHDQMAKGCVIHGFFRCNDDEEYCTFQDLSKLEKLRELSLVVSIKKFPNNEDLEVFKELKGLRKLKILWERSFYFDKSDSDDEEGGSPAPAGEQRVTDDEEQEALRPSTWKKLKCWECLQSSQDDMKDESARSKHLDNLEKLELWCFPNKAGPSWLDPSELKNLEKLCIVGGKLSFFHMNTVKTWDNIKTLRLKYLRYLRTSLHLLKLMFPQMTYLELHQCGEMVDFDSEEEGGCIVVR